MNRDLQDILENSSARHTHLCPRQVLGARIGLKGAAAMGFELPCYDKRMLIILETDGCFADGIEAATGCTVGHRTLRIEDYGKIAATFADTEAGQALRIAPRLDVRERAYRYASGESRHYFAQLQGYQIMPDDELLTIQPVQLSKSVSKIISRAGVRVNCEGCGEEIINEREILLNGRVFCNTCALGGYYSHQEVYVMPQLLFQKTMK